MASPQSNQHARYLFTIEDNPKPIIEEKPMPLYQDTSVSRKFVNKQIKIVCNEYDQLIIKTILFFGLVLVNISSYCSYFQN